MRLRSHTIVFILCVLQGPVGAQEKSPTFATRIASKVAAEGKVSRTSESRTSVSPHARLRKVSPGHVKWTRGFWADRFRLCCDVTLPAVQQALQVPENGAYLGNFPVAAGLEEGVETFEIHEECGLGEVAVDDANRIVRVRGHYEIVARVADGAHVSRGDVA